MQSWKGKGTKRFSKPLAPSQQQLWGNTLQESHAEQGPDGFMQMVLATEFPSPSELE